MNDEKRRVRPLIFAGPLLMALGFGAWKHAQAQSGSDTAGTGARAEKWTEEIFEESTRECGGLSESAKERFVQETEGALGVWRERARVDPAENLKALTRIERALSCASVSSDRLKEERQRIRHELSGAVRLHFAALLRAERQSEPEESLRQVRTLRRVLEAHTGPLSEKLIHLERRLEEDSAQGG